MNEDREELLEIYKLHAELADRISQRREGANKIYIGLITGILIFFAAFLRYGTEAISIQEISLVFGVLGISLSISWLITIRSYRQLNTGKFKALHELEEKLAYPFFKREWSLLGKNEGKGKNIYFKLTIVETFLPVIFCIPFLYFIIISCR